MSNIIKNSKKLLICSLSLLLIGIIVFAIFNFNSGLEYKGYNEVRLSFGEILETEFDAYAEKVTGIAENEGAKVLDVCKGESGINASLIVKFSKDEDNAKNVELIEKVIDAVKNDETYKTEYPVLLAKSEIVEGVKTNNSVIKLVYAITLTLVLSIIYLALRMKLLNTICILASMLHSVLMMFAMVAITRVQINQYIYVVFAVMSVLTLIYSTTILSEIKNNVLLSNNSKKLSESALKNVNILLTVIVFLPILGLLLGNVISFNFALTVVIAVVVAVCSSVIVTAPLYYYFMNYTSPKVIKEETSEE